MSSETTKKLRELNPKLTRREMYTECSICGTVCIHGSNIDADEKVLKEVNPDMRIAWRYLVEDEEHMGHEEYEEYIAGDGMVCEQCWEKECLKSDE